MKHLYSLDLTLNAIDGTHAIKNFGTVEPYYVDDAILGSALAFGIDANVRKIGFEPSFCPATVNDPFSFGAWVKFWDGANIAGNILSSITTGDTTGIKINYTGTSFKFSLSDGYGNWKIWEFAYPVEVLKYYHIFFTYDGLTCRLFVNGEEISGTQTVNDAFTNINNPNNILLCVSEDLTTEHKINIDDIFISDTVENNDTALWLYTRRGLKIYIDGTDYTNNIYEFDYTKDMPALSVTSAFKSILQFSTGAVVQVVDVATGETLLKGEIKTVKKEVVAGKEIYAYQMSLTFDLLRQPIYDIKAGEQSQATVTRILSEAGITANFSALCNNYTCTNTEDITNIAGNKTLALLSFVNGWAYDIKADEISFFDNSLSENTAKNITDAAIFEFSIEEPKAVINKAHLANSDNFYSTTIEDATSISTHGLALFERTLNYGNSDTDMQNMAQRLIDSLKEPLRMLYFSSPIKLPFATKINITFNGDFAYLSGDYVVMKEKLTYQVGKMLFQYKLRSFNAYFFQNFDKTDILSKATESNSLESTYGDSAIPKDQPVLGGGADLPAGSPQTPVLSYNHDTGNWEATDQIHYANPVNTTSSLITLQELDSAKIGLYTNKDQNNEGRITIDDTIIEANKTLNGVETNLKLDDFATTLQVVDNNTLQSGKIEIVSDPANNRVYTHVITKRVIIESPTAGDNITIDEDEPNNTVQITSSKDTFLSSGQNTTIQTAGNFDVNSDGTVNIHSENSQVLINTGGANGDITISTGGVLHLDVALIKIFTDTGYTGSFEFVSDVSQDPTTKDITVTKRTLYFNNGLLVGIA